MDPMGWEVSQLSAPSILYYGPYLPLFTALTINCPTYFTKFYVLIDVFIFLSLLEHKLSEGWHVLFGFYYIPSG